MLSLILLVIVVLFYYIKFKRSRNYLYKLADNLPGPKTWPIIGNALIFAAPQKELLRRFYKVDKNYNSLSRYWIGPILYISIKKPEHIEAILTSTATSKGDVYQIIRDCIGSGLIQSDGMKHKTHRKIMLAPLKLQILENFTHIFDSKGKECAQGIEKHLNGEYFDVIEEVERTSMSLVCETIMGIKMENKNTQNDNLIKIVNSLYKSISERMYKMWLHPYILYRFSKHYKIQKEGMAEFNRFLDNIIKEKKHQLNVSNGKTRKKTSLEHLITAMDGNKNMFSDDEIKEELTTLFTASEDTTMTTTSFVLLMLAMHNDEQQKVWEEQIQILGKDPNVEIQSHHLKEMKYLHMVIEEVLRLFPIAPLIIRKLDKDFTIDNTTLTQGVNIIINMFCTHRDKDIWTEPNEFKPLRFTAKEKENRHPYSHIPFSAGHRSCIGRPFAFMAIKCMISHIIRKYTLYSNWKMDDIILESDITVRSTNGYKIKICSRQ